MDGICQSTVLIIQDLRGGGVWGGEASPDLLFLEVFAGEAGKHLQKKGNSWRACSPPNLPAGDDRVSPASSRTYAVGVRGVLPPPKISFFRLCGATLSPHTGEKKGSW